MYPATDIDPFRVSPRGQCKARSAGTGMPFPRIRTQQWPRGNVLNGSILATRHTSLKILAIDYLKYDRLVSALNFGLQTAKGKFVARMDADIIVTGSAVFDGKTPLKNARFMIDAVNDAARKS